MTQNILELEGKIVDALKTVFDPEIPVNIYDLGLIYEIHVDENHSAKIIMTLTAPNCPVAETLPIEARDAVKKVEGVSDAEVQVVFDPPWTKEMMTDAAKLELGFL